MSSSETSSRDTASPATSSPEASALDSSAPRRLAAILAADIKDYTRLVGIDEEGIVARVTRQFQDLVHPTVERHHGQVIKTMGDGFIAIFLSALDAVRCALALQEGIAEQNAPYPGDQHLRYRIGINLGDVIVAANDVYGDSVNIAARLQLLSEPGGVWISGSVYDQIKNRLTCGFLSLGDERLKNVADPVRVYRVLPAAGLPPAMGRKRRLAVPALVGLLLIIGSAGWFEWAHRSTSTDAQSPPATTAEQHRQIVYQRMVAAMSDKSFGEGWRTLERLAIIAGVTEEEAHDILAEHYPRDIVLGKAKDGKIIARLVDHEPAIDDIAGLAGRAPLALPQPAAYCSHDVERAPPTRDTLLSVLPEQLAAALFDQARIVEVDQNGTLFAAGAPGDGCYRLEEGLLKVTMVSPARGERILAILGPGALVGELSMLDGAPRSASVAAIRPSKLSFVSRAAFDAFAEAHPEVYRHIDAPARAAPARGRQRADCHELPVAQGRVARALLSLARRSARTSAPAAS